MNKKHLLGVLLLVLFFCGVFSVRQYSILAENQSSIARRLQRKNVSVFYDFQLTEDQSVDLRISRPKYGFLGDWLKVDYLHSIVKVENYKNLKQLSGLRNLQFIRISDEEDDLYRLREFSNLKSVVCSLNKSQDVTAFLSSYRLEKLVCRSDQLDFIGRQKDLKDLRLRTLCGDWSGLSLLKNLQKLEIIANGKVDIASLSTLTELRHLTIQCCEFPDFSPLVNLRNLESIDLRMLPMPEPETQSTSSGFRSFYFPPEDVTPFHTNDVVFHFLLTGEYSLPLNHDTM